MSSSVPPSPGPDLRGELLGRRYRLDELIGWGGMASVYAAADPGGRVIALLQDRGAGTKSVVVIRPATL